MPRQATISFKGTKTSKLEIVATFSNEEWQRLSTAYHNSGADKECPQKGGFMCVVEGKGPEEIEILLDLREIVAIV